jgi:dihydroneopterin aldolase
VAEAVVAIIEGEAMNLIERLADVIATRCLAFDFVRAVEVTVHKPHAPLPVRFDDIAVTITRSR